jgi:uncharacterized protein HemX
MAELKPVPDDEPKAENNGARKPRQTRQIDGVEAKLEGVESVMNNAFQASGAALLLAIVALGLAVFLLFKLRALPKAAVPRAK